MGNAVSTATSALLKNIEGLGPALVRGCAWLIDKQHEDGRWSDYAIGDQFTQRERQPIGAATDWATAYAGLALAEAAMTLKDPALHGSTARAAGWLEKCRSYPRGWGFNGHTGPDVDSTAHAILLLRRLGRHVSDGDLGFLISGACPSGGFATFPSGPGEWGRAHADVTPPALLALPAAMRATLIQESAAFLQRERRSDGLWPCYWWKTPYYGSYFALRLDRALGLGIDVPVTGAPENSLGIDDPCDAAFAAAIALLRHSAGSELTRLLAITLDSQSRDGGWKGTRSLRVPRQTDANPWNHQSSPVYEDGEGILTTAHILRVLARIVPEAVSGGDSVPMYSNFELLS